MSNQTNVKSGATTIRTARGESKVVQATRIFCQMSNFSRRFVIQRFISELGLTDKGASTYYQNCRKNAGMVNVTKGTHQPGH
jgi:hypothetical protein